MPETREWGMIHLRLDPEAVGALREEAAGRQTTVTELVRGLVEEHQASRAVSVVWDEIEKRMAAIVARETERLFARHVNRLAGLQAKTLMAALQAYHIARAAATALPALAGRETCYPDEDALEEQVRAYALADFRSRRQDVDPRADEAAAE